MQIDILQIASLCGAIVTVVTLAKLVVQPFQNAIKKNNETMQLLQDTIKTLTFDLKDAQKDRENIHKVLDKHEDRINRTEDEIIVHKEQLKTLFNFNKEK
ncbi:hypothetical protein [Streptococcus equi]|uniref:Phage protein n=1 Tax=Streptococcus equi subsp. ruminatorum TaxID=254358 RepID=A0A6M1L084_9STRE|nr:hypothetical protein [Streptococcus equi]NGL84164.1 hypothetical protein [Streptococcus equi subsp. ruminatorum]